MHNARVILAGARLVKDTARHLRIKIYARTRVCPPGGLNPGCCCFVLGKAFAQRREGVMVLAARFRQIPDQIVRRERLMFGLKVRGFLLIFWLK